MSVKVNKEVVPLNIKIPLILVEKLNRKAEENRHTRKVEILFALQAWVEK